MARERSSAEQAWLLGGLVAVGLAAVAGWFLVVHPELAKGADVRAEARSAQDASLGQQHRVDVLRGQAAQLSKLTGLLAAADAALPPAAGVDSFTRALSDAAHASNVTLTSITAGSPTPAGADGGTAPAGTTTDGTASVGGTAAQPVVGQTYAISVLVVTSGAITDQQAFLHRIQYGSRAVLVTSAALAPQAGSRSGSTLSIQLQVFVQPQSAQDRAELQKLLGTTESN